MMLALWSPLYTLVMAKRCTQFLTIQYSGVSVNPSFITSHSSRMES